MGAAKPTKQDLLFLLARAQARQGGRPSFYGLIWVVFLLAGGVGLLVWLAWPRSTPAALSVITFDQVARPDEAIRLVGQLEPVDPSGQGETLADFELSFADSLLEADGGAVGNGLRAQATTDPDGRARVTWRLPFRATPYPLVVRFAGDEQHASSFDTARVFTLSPENPLLVVEARHSLLDASEAAFRKSNQFALAAFPGTADALKAAVARNYQIVYLAVGPSGAQDYRKLRSWLQRPGPAGGSLFPDGPALGRQDYSKDGGETVAQRAALFALRKQFSGKMVGVVSRPEDARVFHDAGLTTLLVGSPADAPEGVKAVKTWDELAEELPLP